MRTKQNTQPEFVFQLPSAAKITLDYFAAYDAISLILDEHPEIVDRVHQDLSEPLSKTERRGPQGQTCRFSSDTVLRMCVVKVLEGLSYRHVVIRVDDSPRLRAFTGIHNGSMIDYSTFCILANAIQPDTWKAVNLLLAEAAENEGLIIGDKLRIDTTATETNIHWPTDSGLLWDTYRVLERNVQRMREFHPELLSDKRLQAKLAKKLHQRITMTSRHRTAKSKKERNGHYERLIKLVEGILDWLPTVCARVRAEGPRPQSSEHGLFAAEALVQEIEHFLPLGRQAVDQARRRVLDGEQVPNAEKLFSIFEPHTELLKRGRAGKEVEFGHMIAIQQVEGKFITDYGVYEKKPVEHELVDGALESHCRLFGHVPEVFAADKGFWESALKTEHLRKEMSLVAIGKKGRLTDEERALERSLPFRLAQNFRAGVEGSISFLKVMLGLRRCMNKGFKHFVSTVGATVFAHNLLNLAKDSL